MSELGKTTPTGRAKKRVTKAKIAAKKAVSRVLKNYKKKADKAIDSLGKSLRRKTRTKKTAAKRRTAKRRTTKRRK